jgi:glyoxylase-like metal-dependent hydrolase (beta-lactamase superfamily II)
MYTVSRRAALAVGALGAALGLDRRLVFAQGGVAPPADTLPPDMPAQGHYRYTVGAIEVTALYDGIWRKPHEASFIRNASIAETQAALRHAGQTDAFVPIPLTVLVLRIGDRHVMIDAGSGAQWQPTAGRLRESMLAAGIDPASIGQVLISHFHPDHIYGLMARGSNAPVYPNAELVVSAAEYRWWTEPGRVESMPEARRPLGQRINAVFPTWRNFRLVEGEPEVAPGVRLVMAPGHTPGHAAFHVSSGGAQLLISNDTAYVPALLAPHPDWQGSYDQDGPLAVATRRRLIDRAIADAMPVAGAHFPFPGAGRFVRDGNAYAFLPVAA